SGEASLNEVYLRLAAELKSAKKLPRFVGYHQLDAESETLAILLPQEKNIERLTSYTAPPIANTGDSLETAPLIEVVFAETPFYGESGGQLGDHGRVRSGAFEAEVVDVQKPVPELVVAHLRPIRGTLKTGDRIVQETDAEIRSLTARNHTATHLLHWALREILGKHVKQSGSLVGPDHLRFDFAHFQALTEEEIEKVENLINEKIWQNEPVLKSEMPKEDAISAGAIAFFGEKYGDLVRVVRVGDFSTELCGGTHVDHSSDIHLFKIQSESGIAAGVRRIIAVTSKGAFEFLRKRNNELAAVAEKLKAASTDEILSRIDSAVLRERELKKTIEQFQAKSAAAEVDQMLMSAEVMPGARFVASVCAPEKDAMKRLRDLSDTIKQKAPDSIIVLGMKDPDIEKASLIVAIGPQAPKKISANDLLKGITAHIDGKGGGKPDFAQAGGTKPAGLQAALKQASDLVRQALGN
ncbi:MAG: hypothetical protein KGQ59_05735, partial [Bdellovibrionales bacterium]|nr:hypothetical protein [Bdellovibrionales bacterium]